MKIKILKIKSKGKGVSVDWIVPGKTEEGQTHRTHLSTIDKNEILEQLNNCAQARFPDNIDSEKVNALKKELEGKDIELPDNPTDEPKIINIKKEE